MTTPPWEQNIPFKQALAIAAVQKRKYEAKIDSMQQKCGSLEQQIDALQSENAALRNNNSPEVLLATSFPSTSQDSPPNHVSASAGLPSQLEALAISAALWSRAAELLPPVMHPFLSEILHYSSKRQSTGTFLSGNGHLAAPTPVQALVQLLSDILRSSASENTENILDKACNCLAELCIRPDDCVSPADYLALQNFVAAVVEDSCGLGDGPVRNNEGLVVLQNAEKMQTADEQPFKNGGDLKIAATQRQKSRSEKLLENLQKSPGTGFLILGCTAHGLQSVLSQLQAAVLGETGSVPPNMTAGGGRGSGNGGENIPQEPRELEESALAAGCIELTALLQSSLRDLPTWAAAMPPDDGFLRNVAASIWASNDMCNVVAPAHADVAKQGQRCAALLVNALQQMSAVDTPSY